MPRVASVIVRIEDIPEPILAFSMAQMALLQHRMTQETNDRIQLASLVAIFAIVRDRTARHFAQ